MWQHRQKERELKRAEMDLVKQQKQVRQAMRQAEAGELTLPQPTDQFSYHYIDLVRKEGDQLQWLQEQEKRFENFQDSERHKKEEVLW